MRYLPMLLLLLPACSAAPEPEPEPGACADSSPGTVHVFATGFSGTEGITFSPDGRLFVSAGDVIAEVFPDGEWEQIATVGDSIGLAWWGDHLVVAASDSGLDNALDGVFRVDVDTGEVELIGDGIPGSNDGIEGANFITVTPWDTLLVSDPGLDVIQELTAEGDSSVWVEGVTSPNGTAFTDDGNALWAVSTFSDPAPIWQIPVDGVTAGEPTQVTGFAAGSVPDGVALGLSGDLYVAQNIGGRIDRVQPDGEHETLAEGVDWAASLAFGEGDDWDPCSIYATSLFGETLFRVEVGEEGLTPLR